MNDPRRAPIELTSPVADQSWALAATLGVLEARAAELERERTKLEAFAAVAAHELLAPLIMTEAYATLVADRLDDRRHAASRRDLAVLSRHVARVRVLVETLLDDLRSSDRLPQPRPIELSTVARECMRSLAPEVRASGAQVELGRLPRVFADRRLVSVVLTTLITTALRSGRPDGMLVVDGVRHDSHWSMRVAYGPTIPTVAPPRRPRDVAVGLSICRHLVERRGGKIEVSTQNRFSLMLPQRH